MSHAWSLTGFVGFCCVRSPLEDWPQVPDEIKAWVVSWLGEVLLPWLCSWAMQISPLPWRRCNHTHEQSQDVWLLAWHRADGSTHLYFFNHFYRCPKQPERALSETKTLSLCLTAIREKALHWCDIAAHSSLAQSPSTGWTFLSTLKLSSQPTNLCPWSFWWYNIWLI